MTYSKMTREKKLEVVDFDRSVQDFVLYSIESFINDKNSVVYIQMDRFSANPDLIDVGLIKNIYDYSGCDEVYECNSMNEVKQLLKSKFDITF